MRSPRRRFLGIGLTCLAVAVAAPGVAAASANRVAAPVLSQVKAPVPKLVWGPCGEGLEAFQCTTAEVPTDYDRPDGATTTIALTRLPASGPGTRLGTLFTNPGGPGGSGVSFVQQAATIAYAPEVRARYDILGFDPRAVGASDPATCYRSAEAEANSTLLTSQAYPLTARQSRQFIKEGAQLAVQCQTTSPARFAHAGTANVARDMDLLRQAVGDTKLTYYGYSYGTFLGATYARLFPDRVGRFILDGTVDPVAWTGTGTGGSAASVPIGVRTGQGLGASETFGQFARLCREAGPSRCPLAAAGDPAETVPAAFDRLATKPITLPLPDGTTVTLDQSIAVAQTFSALYYPAQWADLAQFLQLIVTPSADPGVATAALARTSTTLGARIRGEDYPSLGGALASLCVDGRQSRRPLQYPAIADAADASAPYFGRYRAWVGLPCEFWGVQDADVFRGPWQQTTRAEVLVIGTRYDPATPYRQTKPFSDLFPNGRMITVNGYGHTTLPPNVSACAAAAETAYLLGGSTPADGTVCQQDADPFGASPGAQARTASPGYLPPPPPL